MKSRKIARQYLIRGRVQGVGFRYFVEREAKSLNVSGYVRNLDDGRVEVYAIALAEQLAELAGLLSKGPRFAEVRGVDENEAAIENVEGFFVRH